MATKVLLCYNDDRNPAYHKVIRMTLPNEWLTLPTKMLLKYYVKAYNSVHAKKLKVNEVHLAKYVGGENDPRKSYDIKLYEPIPSEELISVHIMDRAQVYVRRGKGVEYSSVNDRPTTYDSALRMIEDASSYVTENTNQPTDSFDIDHEEDDASGRQTTVIELQAVPEEGENNNDDDDERRNDTTIVSTAGGRLETKSARVSFKDARQDGTTIEAVRSMTSVASTARRSVVSSSSTKKQLGDDVSGLIKKKSSNDSVGTVSMGWKSHTRSRVGRSIPSRQEYNVEPINSFETISVVTMEEAEDAALIRFRSILDWLGIQPALYDGVVKSLQQELAVLQTDEVKHELVKNKLGALLEASYLNASNKRSGATCSTTSAMKTSSSPTAEKYQTTTVDKRSTVGSITSTGSRVSIATNSNAGQRSTTVEVE